MTSTQQAVSDCLPGRAPPHASLQPRPAALASPAGNLTGQREGGLSCPGLLESMAASCLLFSLF